MESIEHKPGPALDNYIECLYYNYSESFSVHDMAITMLQSDFFFVG